MNRVFLKTRAIERLNLKRRTLFKLLFTKSKEDAAVGEFEGDDGPEDDGDVDGELENIEDEDEDDDEEEEEEQSKRRDGEESTKSSG